MAEKACAGGVDWIQLRLKDISYENYREVALKVQEVCRNYDATFIINDNVKLALDINSDGVHVGKDDTLTQADIDELLRRGMIIGCTTNTIEDVLHFEGKAVSYLGLGPFRFTTTKQKLSPVLGIEGYKHILNDAKEKMTRVPPIIGIGGITEEDVPALLATGLHGVAVSGAISNADDITTAAKGFKQIFNYQHQ
jgi:thiamine-phosphate pyrophosphorylase